MPATDMVFVRCQLSRGGFSSELVFRLSTAAGEEFVGSAPVQYCRKAGGAPLGPKQPTERGRQPGWVAARVIRDDGNGGVWLSFPDGSVAPVSAELVDELQAGESPRVPLQS